MNRAYKKAYSWLTYLEKEYAKAGDYFKSNSFSIKYKISFEYIIGESDVAINMTIPTCVDFLTNGKYFNIYELARWETKKSGKALEEEVKRRSGNFYFMRKAIEKRLGFSRKTHYASLNVGGTGASRYGECCVIFNKKKWENKMTSFGGDSILTCFDNNGSFVLSSNDLKTLFTIDKATHKLAVIKRKEHIAKINSPALKIKDIISIMESDDSIIEFHIHNEINTEDIREIRIPSKRYRELWNLTEEASLKKPPLARQYDIVPYFKNFIKLSLDNSIPLKELGV